MSSSEILSSSSPLAGEVDPLLRDLNERKQNFKRNVVSMAAELKDVKSRLASQEQLYSMEKLTRQRAEEKARDMEKEIHRMRKTLDEKCAELQATVSNSQKSKELENLRSHISATQATADANAASAQSAYLRCFALLRELNEKDKLEIEQEQEHRVKLLGEQLDFLQKDLIARENFQQKLKDELLRIEHGILKAITEATYKTESELRKVLDEIFNKILEKINCLLIVKDKEIARLKDEGRNLSACWELRNKDLESELERQRRTDQDLRKRVLNLEFCFQGARSQTRKLRKIGEQRDKTLKELKRQLATKQEKEASNNTKQKFWESSTFKIIVPMSILILVVIKIR